MKWSLGNIRVIWVVVVEWVKGNKNKVDDVMSSKRIVKRSIKIMVVKERLSLCVERFEGMRCVNKRKGKR